MAKRKKVKASRRKPSRPKRKAKRRRLPTPKGKSAKPLARKGRQRSAKRASAKTERKVITTRTGGKFTAYRREKRFKRAHYFKPGSTPEALGRYFDAKLRPEFWDFYKEHRPKGRTQYSFKIKVALNIKGDRIPQYISSLRDDYIEDSDFESNIDRFRADFVSFMEEYLFRKAMSSLSVLGVGMETLYIPKKRKKRARKPKKTSRKKASKKTVRRSRHRKR